MESLTLDLLLFCTALFAGAVNAVAGGGTFFVFPALLLSGISPISANATSTIALWPGAVASVVAFRRELRGLGIALIWMMMLGAVGGYIGAKLLLITDNQTFEKMIPWLLLIATFFFAYGKNMAQMMDKVASRSGISRHYRMILSIAFQIIIALYGGFFGAGIGILTLAMLQLLGEQDLHKINAMKTVIASSINASAFFTFVFSDIVAWDKALLMAVGGIAGGYGGAWLTLRVSPLTLRRIVLITACAMTVYFFWKYYVAM